MIDVYKAVCDPDGQASMLTKREFFAALIMSGASGQRFGSTARRAIRGVAAADQLIRALNLTPEDLALEAAANGIDIAADE